MREETKANKKYVIDRKFSNKAVQIANKLMKRRSTSSAIREMQSKTTMRYHFTPTRMAVIKIYNNKC